MIAKERQTAFPVGGADDSARRGRKGATSERLPRLDVNPDLRERLLPLCRLKRGEIWEDPLRGHRVGVLDAASAGDVAALADGARANLAINDPPYNLAVGGANTRNLPKMDLSAYMSFCRKWLSAVLSAMADDAHFYCWIGADYRDNFQPLPDFMILAREFDALSPRNLITVRNQRGYGVQDNWMWIRQELLHYTLGKPKFRVVYTDIPKILRGYYKTVNGRVTENGERGKSDTIRPGNVWVDIQQVFYRMKENAPGCYAQKPLAAIKRIMESSSREGDVAIDPFAHSGTTLIAAELTGRTAFTSDIDPVFAEISIRRLERLRRTGEPGWQWRNPFPEIDSQSEGGGASRLSWRAKAC